MDYTHIEDWLQREEDELLYVVDGDVSPPPPTEQPVPTAVDLGFTFPSPCEGAGVGAAIEPMHRWPDPTHWPDPTQVMLDSPEFKVIWNVMKTWDTGMPHAYTGYCGVKVNLVRAILEALQPWLDPENRPPQS